MIGIHLAACPSPQFSGQINTLSVFSFTSFKYISFAVLISQTLFKHVTKRKLQRFEELKSMQRVFQYPYFRLEEIPDLKGKWNENVFKRHAPIVLELGCGRGEYTIGLSRNDVSKNYVGLDIKGARLWRGAKTANDENLLHVSFIRTTIEHLHHFFSENELSEIWITFPDPQPPLVREKKRLTHQRFLKSYETILKPGGLLHLKTDDLPFFQYSIESLNSFKGKVLFKTEDLYNYPPEGFDLSIKTTYELIFLAKQKKICYLVFEFE